LRLKRKFKKIFFHISSCWVRIRLHAKNQLSRLPGSGLKCNHSGGNRLKQVDTIGHKSMKADRSGH
jgi:hypothetical protein